MNQNQHQKLQTLVKYSKNHFLLKKTLQFLISISLFSLLISYSSTLYLYFRTFIFPLFTHTVERKYIFLLCNGILAFLSMNLDFSSSSRVGSDLGKDQDGGKSASPVADKEEAMESLDSLENFALVAQENEKEDEEEENGPLNTEVDESGALVIVEEEEESGCLITAESAVVAEKTEEEENEELSNTEELNKKFDEFIRRMKEGLRIEAQRQLIAV